MAERWEDWFDDGETLLWQGAPEKVMHWGVSLFISAFGIPFLLGGLFCASQGLEILAESKGIFEVGFALFLIAFSLPFISVGCAMVFGVWIVSKFAPGRTCYALTNKAGYIATNFWHRKMDVFPLMADIRVEFIEHRRGTSTIYLHFEEKIDSDGDQLTSKKGFTDIADGQEVYHIIRDIQAGKSQ